MNPARQKYYEIELSEHSAHGYGEMPGKVVR